MNRHRIIEEARSYVKKELERDSSGHDWWHIVRVAGTAKRLAALEQADVFICELSALLHDIADEKLNPDKEAGLSKVEQWLEEAGVDVRHRQHVMEIISTMSFRGGRGQPMSTLEGRIVQDADRLDAIGAIGIARTFAYAGWKGHALHHPELPPREHMTKEQYRNEPGTAINHFHEKLLKLKSLMNTEAARALAEERHSFMNLFLERFDQEWYLGDDVSSRFSPSVQAGDWSGYRTHVVFGPSARGTVKLALRSRPQESVISLDDDLMHGPLEGVGGPSRLAWWKQFLNEEDRADMIPALLKHFMLWQGWPRQIKGSVVLWAGNSATEQIGLRYALAALPEDIPVSVIDVTSELHRLYPDRDYRNAAQASPGQLAGLADNAVSLSGRDRADQIEDWNRLVADGGLLRIVENGSVRTVDEGYFDALILETAHRLLSNRDSELKAARLVGEIIGVLDQPVSDTYIEYRLRKLLDQGQLEYTGSLQAMRYYSVKLAT
ncbi:DUF3658 domain-containing protein [Paenibacillus naphthalenovorans]|uniref:DUF3658 domain-containing protein n=1 Tax=Paenibacillus naphthalenovorans TaxID=162209 RepID=UPI003D2DAE29